MPDEEARPRVDRYVEVPEAVREWLEEMRPEEVAAAREFCRMSPEDRQMFREGLRLLTAISLTSKFMRWAIISCASIVGAFVLLRDFLVPSLKGWLK